MIQGVVAALVWLHVGVIGLAYVIWLLDTVFTFVFGS